MYYTANSYPPDRGWRPTRINHVAIIGGGFSGTLQAINLLAHDGPRVTLIERRDVFAKGLAYSTTNPTHLLNVRATNMSARPDDPGHFIRWLQQRSGDASPMFASRRDYGVYLGAMLDEAMRKWPGRLTLVRDQVEAIEFAKASATLHLATGGTLQADAAILALGNLPPHDPPALAKTGLSEDIYIRDPWAVGDVGADLTDADTLLIMGTGLTMVDIVLTLETQSFGGRVVAMSRRGLLPRVHAPLGQHPRPLSEKPAFQGAKLLRFVRSISKDVGWRDAVDALRPYAQAMWLSASLEEQRRFLRHQRAWWDVHRHRLAPPVADRIEAKRADGSLDVTAAALIDVEARDGGAIVTYRARHDDAHQRMAVRRIINCTGPQGDLLRTREPLLRQMMASGYIRPDAHSFGIEVNAQAEAIDARGMANPRLFALGPLTRGTFWEIVAVPDIRVQTWSLARRLSNAHWVGGEGL